MKVYILVHSGRDDRTKILGVFAKRKDAEKAFKESFIKAYAGWRKYCYGLYIGTNCMSIDLWDEEIGWGIIEKEVQR